MTLWINWWLLENLYQTTILPFLNSQSTEKSTNNCFCIWIWAISEIIASYLPECIYIATCIIKQIEKVIFLLLFSYYNRTCTHNWHVYTVKKTHCIIVCVLLCMTSDPGPPKHYLVKPTGLQYRLCCQPNFTCFPCFPYKFHYCLLSTTYCQVRHQIFLLYVL